MKEDIRLIVPEHLGYQLHVHVLDVDLLQRQSTHARCHQLTRKHTCILLFISRTASLSFSCTKSTVTRCAAEVCSHADHVGDNSRQQKTLFALMRALLPEISRCQLRSRRPTISNDWFRIGRVGQDVRGKLVVVAKCGDEDRGSAERPRIRTGGKESHSMISACIIHSSIRYLCKPGSTL